MGYLERKPIDLLRREGKKFIMKFKLKIQVLARGQEEMRRKR